MQNPVVWTLHDMNPFTGGCHYDLGCERYVDHCNRCPQLGSTIENDLSFKIWERKRGVLSRISRSRLHIVTPSKWLAKEVKRSSILGEFPVSVIPYGLNLDDFVPKDRFAIRDLLGIPQDAMVVLFVAERPDNRRKGFSLLIDALNRAAGAVPSLFLLSLGDGKPQAKVKIPWMHVGALNNDRFLSMVYSAADVFVICSSQDNLPNTVLEAMACGVPVVGVEVGGIPDMVRSGETGITVSSADASGLSAAICLLLNDSNKRKAMKATCRRVAVAEYGLELQAKRYAEIYESLT